MKRIYLIAAAFVLLFFLCGVGSALAEGRPFVTKWDCKKGKEIPIPIVGTYKMLITDANGQEKVNETVTVRDANSPYIFKPSEDGIYTVTAGPEGIEYFRTMYQFRDFKELIEVVQFGSVEWTSMELAFVRCERMNFAANIDNPNLSRVTSMSNMFFECEAFNSSLKGWDVSHVTDMSQMFYKCASFNQSLEGWDVSHVTNMHQMFYHCTSFNQSLEGWDVSHVTNMSQMFSNCTSFNQPLKWDVSKVTDMEQMFIGCASFNQSLEGWDVSHVTDMSNMFSRCTSFNQPLNWDVSNVTDMSSMFSDCTSFNQSLEGWDVSKVTNMEGMFYGCTTFNQSLEGWDVSKVTDMRDMFFGCTSFNQSLAAWKIKTAVGSLNLTKMSVENYSKSLVGWAEWAKQADIRDIRFDNNVQGLVYNAKGKAARAELIKRGWTFEGDKELTFEVILVQPDHGTLAIEGYTTETLKKVNYDTELTVTATTSEAGYELKEIQVNGTKLEGKTFTVKADTKVTAVFGLKTFPVTASVKDGKGGTVKLEGAANLDAVEYGTTLTVVATPDEANGYKLKAVTVNGTPLAEGVMTFEVKEAKTVEVEFALKTFSVSKELKGVTTGEITITGAANLDAVEYGTDLTVEATTSEEGYGLKEIQVNGTKLEGKTFTVKADTKVTAVFGLKTFSVTKELKGVTTGEITITGATDLNAVVYGTELTVEATTSEEGYELKELQVNGKKLEGKTFTVKADTKVTAVFEKKNNPPTPPTPPTPQPNPTPDPQQETFEVTLTQPEHGTLAIEGYTTETLKAVAKGTELKVKATPKNEGGVTYELKELKANDVDIKGTMKFTVTAKTTVTARFEKKQGGKDNKDKNPKKPEAVEDAVLASLSVAPNPFTAQLRILNPEGIVGRYEVVNLMGAVLRSGVINGYEVIVDTEALPAGLYFVRLEAQGGARKTLKVYRN